LCTPRESPIRDPGREGVKFFRCCHAQPIAEVERARSIKLESMRAELAELDEIVETVKLKRSRACIACYLKGKLLCHEHTSMPMLCQTVTDLFMLGKVPHWIAMLLALTIFFGGIGIILGGYMRLCENWRCPLPSATLCWNN
jgi:hypothetical protein